MLSGRTKRATQIPAFAEPNGAPTGAIEFHATGDTADGAAGFSFRLMAAANSRPEQAR